MSDLLDFAVITIFAREVLEGGIIIGEYRTVILRTFHSELTQKEALRAVTLSAVTAAAFALVVCAAIAIPLAILSREFNNKTAILIEGVSKIVAALCILGLSLKMPKFFGLYYSKSQVKRIENGESGEDVENSNGLSLRSIWFNVSWNIWREVAECGVFLIPFFLTGDGIKAIPLSAVVGSVVGAIICIGIYYANQRMKRTVGLTIFTVSLLLILSTGLFSGGCHKFEMVYGYTHTVWELKDDFWSVERLPMTIFKPFGYSDKRTVLQIVTFWGYLSFGLFLHWRKYRLCRKPCTADVSSGVTDLPESQATDEAVSSDDDNIEPESQRTEEQVSFDDDDIEADQFRIEV